MAVITDPDTLVLGTDVIFDTTTYEIEIVTGTNVDSNGIDMGILYSFAKDRWKDQGTLIAHPFPFNAIDTDAGKFEVGFNGTEYSTWKFKNAATRKLVRQAGWVEYQGTSTPVAEYAGIATLGNIDATDKDTGDKAYYYFSSQSAATEFTYAGPVDEAVQIYGDASNGNVNYKSDILTVAIRIYDKEYGQSTTTEIGKTVKAQLLTFAVSENSDDLNVSATDVTADAYGVTVTWEASAVNRDFDGSPYPFSITIDANNRTIKEVYEAVQSLLRKTTDIDENLGGHIGLLTDQLVTFTGATLVTAQGVYITNFQEADRNSIEFYDDNNVKRTYNYVASGSITFNPTLVADGANAKYWMFYTSSMDSDTPVAVLDASDVAITGTVTGLTNNAITFTYDYDNDTGNGEGAGADKPVTVVAIGTNNASYVITTSTIKRSKANDISLVAGLERNYSNPA